MTGPGVTTSRLAGVRHRAMVARRRRATAALAAVVVLAGAATGLPRLPLFHQEVQPATQAPAEFPDFFSGDPLGANSIAAPGAGELTLKFTPSDANVAVRTTCFIDRAIATKYGEKPDGITSTLSVNGHALNVGCSQGAFTEVVQDGQDAAANRKGWAKLGVKPGRESTLTFTYLGTPPHSLRLAVAVYDLSGARVKIGGYSWHQSFTYGGKQYELGDYDAQALTGSVHSASVPVQAGDVVCGVTFAKEVFGDDQLTPDGAALNAATKVGDIRRPEDRLTCATVRTADKGATVTYRADDGSQGTAVVAVYRPAT